MGTSACMVAKTNVSRNFAVFLRVLEYCDEVKTGLMMVRVCVLHKSKKNWESFWPLFLYHI